MYEQATVSCVGLMSAISSASGHSDAVTCMTGPLKQEGDPTVSTYTSTWLSYTIATFIVEYTRVCPLELMKSTTADADTAYIRHLIAVLLLLEVSPCYVIGLHCRKHAVDCSSSSLVAACCRIANVDDYLSTCCSHILD
jgi:hypothetical protein